MTEGDGAGTTEEWSVNERDRRATTSLAPYRGHVGDWIPVPVLFRGNNRGVSGRDGAPMGGILRRMWGMGSRLRGNNGGGGAGMTGLEMA